jgi:hypothetical protein
MRNTRCQIRYEFTNKNNYLYNRFRWDTTTSLSRNKIQRGSKLNAQLKLLLRRKYINVYCGPSELANEGHG